MSSDPKFFYIRRGAVYKVNKRSDLPEALELIRIDNKCYHFIDHTSFGTNGANIEIMVPINTVDTMLPSMSLSYTEVRVKYSDGKTHAIQVRNQSKINKYVINVKG